MKHLTFILLLVMTCSLTKAQQDDRGYIVKVGEKAPNIELLFPDGTKKQLKDLTGKVIMIQFTASWCGVCRKEMPFIEKDIWLKYKNNPEFALFGIDFKESKETTEKFAKDIKITYPLLLDPEGKAFYTYAAQGAGVTRNIIIDKKGNIAFLTRLYDPIGLFLFLCRFACRFLFLLLTSTVFYQEMHNKKDHNYGDNRYHLLISCRTIRTSRSLSPIP